ncbi:MAG: NAD-dependent epimerase/dehydratase family protein [Polyangiaceae bacterium]|nr:NAD-dependent epimerase/dehydratase family protein [Polyangiaceae bacterium]
MRVLLIGGTRHAGYALTWRLIAAGARVTLLNRGLTPDPFGDRVERLIADRTTPDFAEVLADRSFDATVDFVAYVADDAHHAVKVLGRKRTGHYVFISTGQVYLVREGCPKPPQTPLKEEDYDGPVMARPNEGPERSQWDYGVGKRQCEDVLVEAYKARHFPSTRIRIPMVNGERDYDRRLEAYLIRMLDGGPILLPDGGQNLVRHVYAGEVARAIAGILGQEKTFGQAYNLSQPEIPSLAEMLSMVAEMLGARPRFISVPAQRIVDHGLVIRDVSPFSGRWMSLLDPRRAEAELGFRHEPLERSLEKIVASYLAHPPPSPPEGYAQRRDEIALAETLERERKS